jgi:hypothetical protein
VIPQPQEPTDHADQEADHGDDQHPGVDALGLGRELDAHQPQDVTDDQAADAGDYD